MLKFLKHIVYFSVLSVIFYIVSICIWGDLMPKGFKNNVPFNLGGVGHLFTRLHEAKQVSNVDVLVLGSSLAYRGFDPRVFKNHQISLFNLGSSAQTPIQTELILSRYLNQLQPQIVILEVNPLYFSNDGVESSIDLFSNDSIDLDSFKSAIILNSIKSYNTLIYGFYKDITGCKSVYVEPIRKGEDTYITNGFVERHLRYNKDSCESKINWSFNNYQLRAFENVIHLLKSAHVNYFLVQTPVTKLRYMHTVKMDSFNNYIDKQGRYYNFNELMTLNDQLHFYDSHHLNQKGVIEFNEFFIKTLFLGSDKHNN